MKTRGNLLIQTAFVGDLLLTIPLARRLKELFPDRPLVLLCRQGLGDILLRAGVVDRVIEVDKKNKRSWSEARQALRKDHQGQFHWVVCPHRSFRSAILVSSLRAKQKVGYKLWWNGIFFNQRVLRPMQEAEVIRQLFLLKGLDSLTGERLEESLSQEVASSSISYQVPEWSQMTLSSVVFASRDELFHRFISSENDSPIDRRWIYVAPGSVWPTKRWTLTGYKDLVKKLLTQGYGVILIGSPDEAKICQEIVSDLQNPEGLLNLAGKTSLWQSLLLMSKASAVVSNDSGAMHMAVACGVPSVSIFGPTTMNLGYRPWQNRAQVIENKDLDCRPCGLHGHKKCPIGTHECMTSVPVQKVLQSVLSLLGSK